MMKNMEQQHVRSFWANAVLFALVITMTLKVSPYLGSHAEYEPFTITSFLEWIASLEHLAFCGVFAYVAVVVSVQLSAMGFPFDGRILEGTYRYFGITDVDRIADVKLMLSPLSAWLVFWIDARIRRARSTKPA